MTKDTVSDFRSVAATGSTWQHAAGQIIRTGTLTMRRNWALYVSEEYGNDLDPSKFSYDKQPASAIGLVALAMAFFQMGLNMCKNQVLRLW